MYNGPEGLARGKGRKTVSRAGARRLGQLSSPDVCLRSVISGRPLFSQKMYPSIA